MRQSGVVCAIGDRSADCRWPAASDSRTRAVAREWNSLFGFWLTPLVNDNWTPLPLSFTSVDSKGTLSCLESPLIEAMILKDLGREIGTWKGKLFGSADFKWDRGTLPGSGQVTGRGDGSRPPTLFLKRYDSKGVSGWGSVPRTGTSKVRVFLCRPGGRIPPRVSPRP
jgi:hypothetical protein